MSTHLGCIFRQHVKGHNFMTPQIINYIKSGDFICEISTGDKFLNTPIYGVTVLDTNNNIKRNDLSKCFDSLEKAESYIRTLGIKVYTMDDAKNLKYDISVLSLPKRVYCDSKETLSIIAGKFAECHIGTSVNWEQLFIQT